MEHFEFLNALKELGKRRRDQLEKNEAAFEY